MRRVLLIFFLSLISLQGQSFKFGQAKGFFLSLGIGPKIPIGDFAESQNIGVGFDFTVSYTDNKILPVFLYAGLGFQHYPGRQKLYKSSDYASISSNVVALQAGVRNYFSPILENVVILMPILEGGISYALFETWHEFKADRSKTDYLEESSKLGFHIGGGFSMFLLDVIGYYNYFNNYQFLSFDLRIRIPIFVSF